MFLLEISSEDAIFTMFLIEFFFFSHLIYDDRFERYIYIYFLRVKLYATSFYFSNNKFN